MKNLGQRAFIAYFKSIYIQKDKDVFKVEELPAEAYAASLGLPGAPKLKSKVVNPIKKRRMLPDNYLLWLKLGMMVKFQRLMKSQSQN